MRTTLTLEPEVAEKLRSEAASGKRSFKEIVNEALKLGLGISSRPPQKPIEIETFSSKYLPGVDHTKFNQIYDELLAEEFLAKRQRHVVET